MEPKEIFELIIKADEKLKYATSERSSVRVRQARDLLVTAIDEARAIGNETLARQAEQRLVDLGPEPIADDPAGNHPADPSAR